MKLSTKTQKILEFLQEWQAEEHLYCLMHFHNMEFYQELEEVDFLEAEFDGVGLPKYFKDTFTVFALEDEYLAFWRYPELKGEPPVISWSSVGCEPKFLAGSLNDLVCKIVHNIGFNGGWHEQEDKQPTKEDFENKCYDIAYNKEISEEEVKQIILKERQEFKERAFKLIDFVSEEQIEKNIKKHPYFLIRRQQFDLKSYEVYFLGREIKNKKEFAKLLNYLEQELRSIVPNLTYYSKENVIFALEENYPNYCKSLDLKTWLSTINNKPKITQISEVPKEKVATFFIASYINLNYSKENKTDFVQGLKAKYPEQYELYKQYIDKIGTYNVTDFPDLMEALMEVRMENND